MTNQQKAMSRMMKVVWSTYVLPTIDKGSDIGVKPIQVNAALYENDYAEYIARKHGQLKHIHNTKDKK